MPSSDTIFRRRHRFLILPRRGKKQQPYKCEWLEDLADNARRGRRAAAVAVQDQSGKIGTFAAVRRFVLDVRMTDDQSSP
jgi:hypothetical protein